MYEVPLNIFYIIMYPEILLSFIVLGLVIYGVNQLSTLKITVIVLILMGIWVSLVELGDFGENFSLNVAQSFWLCHITNGLLMINGWITISKIIIVIGSFSVILMGQSSGFPSSPVLILIVTLSSLLLISAINWLSLYLALELQTLSLFILVALKRDSAYSTEAGLKYFVLGALSSGLFLFGCVLLYGLTGEVSIQGVNLLLEGEIGRIFITISLLFKLSVAPFHMWAPDVYEGAPTTITALLATVPKIGVYSILVQIGPTTNVILICAVISIIFGAIGALNQTRIKRLLAYSGIGHMGFILFGVAIGSFESIQASFIYMIIYVIMSICSFSLILSLNLSRGLLVELSGISRNNPVIAMTLAVVFFSIAGIPPLAGFLSKWFILLSGIYGGYYLFSLVVVISSVIAGVYYVRIVKLLYFQTDSPLLVWQRVLNRESGVDFTKSILIGVTLFLILFFMICPNFLLQITHDATICLY